VTSVFCFLCCYILFLLIWSSSYHINEIVLRLHLYYFITFFNCI
jgi:hypothetical protein